MLSHTASAPDCGKDFTFDDKFIAQDFHSNIACESVRISLSETRSTKQEIRSFDRTGPAHGTGEMTGFSAQYSSVLNVVGVGVVLDYKFDWSQHIA
jgi:hypothetical protein